MSGASRLFAELLLATAVLTVVGCAGACLSARAWRGTPHLAGPFALLAVGLSGATCFAAYLISPGIGSAAAWALVLAAVLVTGRSAWRARSLIARNGTTVLAPALLAAGTLVGTVGLLTLWRHDANWFELARIRFIGPLPRDNQLPAQLADALLRGGDPRGSAGGDWKSSDRPPLQAGLLLLVQGTVGMGHAGAAGLSFATSVVSQACWLPAGWALLRALGAGRRATTVALLFAAASGTVLVNTVFTWPKLLSAAFVVAALAVLLELPRFGRPGGPLAAAGVLVVLGALSHGAAVFAAPLVLYAVIRARRSLSLRGVGTAAVLAIAVYAPWMAYQRWYDPPGDRLLKWHLAGVVAPTTKSFGSTLITAYTGPSRATILHLKLGNLATPVTQLPWAQVWDAFTGDPSGRRTVEFFTLSAALGLGVVPLLLLLAVAARSRVRSVPGEPLVRRSVPLLGAVAASLVFWCLLMYGPKATVLHQGSHVPVIILLTVPVAWAAGRWPRATAVLIALQIALLAATYGPAGAAVDTFSPVGAAAIAAGLLLLGGAVAAARPAATDDERPDDDADGPADPWDTRPLPAPVPAVDLLRA